MRQIFKIFLTAKHAKPTFAKATVGKKDAERTKSKSYSSVLCDLCVIPIAIGTLRPLRLMDFSFFNTTVLRYLQFNCKMYS